MPQTQHDHRAAHPNGASPVSRRNLLRLLGAGSAGVALGPSRLLAQAATTAPSADAAMQGAGFFTFAVGEAKVSVVSDGGFVMRPSEIFPEVPRDELARAAKDAHVSAEAYPGQVNTLLIRRGSDVILIDAGCGRAFGPTTGFLVPNLARAGVRPADVTHVILSHAHPDHIGGLMTGDAPTFPRAKVLVSRDEHQFWTGPDPTMPGSLAPAELQKMVIAAARAVFEGVKGSLELVSPDDTVAGVVKLIDAAGHTPGHMAMRIGTTTEEHMLYFADALHIPPLQLTHLNWHTAYDTDPMMAAVARRRLLELARKEEMLAAGAHASFPALGYVDQDGDGYRWTPKIWSWGGE